MSDVPVPEPMLVSQVTARQMLAIGKTTVVNLCNAGQLERVKIGRRSLVTLASIKAFAEKLKG